jgi:hypothetical protein
LRFIYNTLRIAINGEHVILNAVKNLPSLRHQQ